MVAGSGFDSSKFWVDLELDVVDVAITAIHRQAFSAV